MALGVYSMAGLKEYTREQLEKFNGKNGARALVAVRGKVYEVINMNLWEEGEHMGIHQAGKDNTGDFAESPHAESILAKLTLVGTMVQEP